VGKLYLIRHGRAAGGWTDDPDPGLDPQGVDQARAMVGVMGPRGPMDLMVSPLLRTRLTAAPLAEEWAVVARVEARIGEIPSPAGPEGELASRGAWLGSVMSRRWDDPGLSGQLGLWRSDLVAALSGVEGDVAVVSHFVAINAAVGHAIGDARVTVFRPGYCSVTVLDNDGGRLSLVELGGESVTVVR
jgi:broad specificity phosphatase PhoE